MHVLLKIAFFQIIYNSIENLERMKEQNWYTIYYLVRIHHANYF